MLKLTAFAAALTLAATGGAMAQNSRAPTDTGNMAYPAPLPQGNLSTTTTTGASRAPTDTGNMAYPAPLPQGNLSTTTTGGPRRPTDTGNMAYPSPLPQGNVGRSTTTK